MAGSEWIGENAPGQAKVKGQMGETKKPTATAFLPQPVGFMHK
ncbi:MAG: hypothetical protein WC789_02770 [Lentisphaeria bacterium]|jgi:hypothetical protein